MISNKVKRFYITTPIYYPNDVLHIGHAYTTVLADILSRYKKMSGYETYFLTGSDEHGEKIERKAKALGITPIEFVNDIVKSIKELWKLLGIKYSRFIRTTNKQHEEIIRKIFSKLYYKKDIYKGIYEGAYCVNCEEFLTFFQMNVRTGQCLNCKGIFIRINEPTYFFKVSKYISFLVDYYSNHPNFLEPIVIKNELITNFVKPGLHDLSITRISTKWGISTLEDSRHVIYVWFDALLSYITALGYLTNDDTLFRKFWNNDNVEIVHLLGKEISRFHFIYWPIILNSLNLRQPTKLISHGWILFENNKMSKSLGNVIDPVNLIKLYGCDLLRFYFGYEISFEKDKKFSYEIYFKTNNNNLVNNIGNLVFRTTSMIERYFNGILLNKEIKNNKLLVKVMDSIFFYKSYMNRYYISKAIGTILELCKFSNKYIDDSKPWKLKENKKNDELLEVLIVLSYAIVVSAFLLSPILIESSQKILDIFGILLSDLNFDNINDYHLIINNKKIIKKDILFKKINIEEELTFIKNKI